MLVCQALPCHIFFLMSMQIYFLFSVMYFCVGSIPRQEGEDTDIDKEKELRYSHPVSVLDQGSVQV